MKKFSTEAFKPLSKPAQTLSPSIPNLDSSLKLQAYYSDVVLEKAKENGSVDGMLFYHKAFNITQFVLTRLLSVSSRRYATATPEQKEKRIYFIGMEEIEHPSMPSHYVIGSVVEPANNQNKKDYTYSDGGKQGLYKLSFSVKGEIKYAYYCFYACDPTNYSEMFDTFFSQHELYAWTSKRCQQVKKKSKKITTGVFRCFIDNNGVLHYQDYSDKVKNSPETHHQEKSKILESVDYWFNGGGVTTNLELGGTGQHKIMIAGNPGTGKSNLLYEIANMYKDTHCIVYAPNMAALHAHSQNVKDSSVPTIVFMEDVENMFDKRQNNQEALNVLSGIDEARCKNGLLLIMTTNKPEIIEDRVMRRPDRVNEHFKMGNLDEKSFIAVVTHYFSGYLKDVEKFNYTKFAKNVFDYLSQEGSAISGAEVKNIAQRMSQYMAKDKEFAEKVKNGKATKADYFTIKRVKEVVEAYKVVLKEVDSVSKSKSLFNEDKAVSNVGFRSSGGFTGNEDETYTYDEGDEELDE